MNWINYIVTFSIISDNIWTTVASGCTFPSFLQTTWETTRPGEITFTSSEINSLDFGTYGKKTMGCHLTEGTKYVTRVKHEITSGVEVYLYTCLDIQRVSSTTALFWIAHDPEAANNNQPVALRSLTAAVTVAEICDTSSYPAGTYDVFIRKDSINGAKIRCPDTLTGNFSYVINFGASDLCTSSSRMDVCSDVGRMQMDLSICSTKVFYSGGGDVTCVYASESGGKKYLTVYNNDQTVDGSSGTFRFTCIVYKSTNNLYASQHASTCIPGQSANTVPGGGAKITFTNLGCTNPPTTTTAAPTTTPPKSNGNIPLLSKMIIIFWSLLQMPNTILH